MEYTYLCVSLGTVTSSNTANEPSGSDVMPYVTGCLTLSYLHDFDTGFFFFYSSSTVASVFAYDRLNATANLLATIELTAQSSDSCIVDPSGCYYNWVSVEDTSCAYSFVYRRLDGVNAIV
jgi:hypothetical protein